MEKNRKRFLDKVVEFLIKDTIIDYGDNHIDFPFFPEYGLYINDANLDYFFHMSRYTQYCKDNYGLSHHESLYVWGIYIKIIKEKIKTNGESLNESDDRRKIYLSKVIGFLVKDTIIDYSREKIHYPFPALFFKSPIPFSEFFFDTSSESFISFDVSPFIDLYMYCNNTYGLTEEETTYVWEKYKTIILDKIENGR